MMLQCPSMDTMQETAPMIGKGCQAWGHRWARSVLVRCFTACYTYGMSKACAGTATIFLAHLSLCLECVSGFPCTSRSDQPGSAAGIVKVGGSDKWCIVGEGSSKTECYDLQTSSWSGSAPERPCVGNHHCTVNFGGVSPCQRIDMIVRPGSSQCLLSLHCVDSPYPIWVGTAL